MSDCANVEIRELLPELIAGTLDASTRARVEEHIGACADCAAELETLRLVRAAFAHAPAVDARRIAAVLPKPAARRAAQHGALAGAPPVKRWLDWRIAAGLTMITVGGLSLAVSQRLRPVPSVNPPDSIRVVVPGVIAPRIDSSAPTPSGAVVRDTQTPLVAVPRTERPRTPTTKAELSFGGGMGDLDDASLKALLGALDAIDRAPVAPSAEPDRSPVLPVIKEGDR